MADEYGRITGVPHNPDDYSRMMGVEGRTKTSDTSTGA
jgi:hypothetical protein